MQFAAETAQIADLVRAELTYQRRSQHELVPVLGMSGAGVSRRLHGRVPFTVPELIAVAELLGEPLEAFLPGARAKKLEAAVAG